MSCPDAPILSPLRLVEVDVVEVAPGLVTGVAVLKLVVAPLEQLAGVTFVMTIGVYPGADTTPPETIETGADYVLVLVVGAEVLTST